MSSSFDSLLTTVMNKQLWLDFQVALDDVKKDPKIEVLIITGQGRAFSTSVVTFIQTT